MKTFSSWINEDLQNGDPQYDDHFPKNKLANYLSADDHHPHGHEEYFKKADGNTKESFVRDVAAVTPMIKAAVNYLMDNSDNYQYQAHVLSAALGKSVGHY